MPKCCAQSGTELVLCWWKRPGCLVSQSLFSFNWSRPPWWPLQHFRGSEQNRSFPAEELLKRKRITEWKNELKVRKDPRSRPFSEAPSAACGLDSGLLGGPSASPLTAALYFQYNHYYMITIEMGVWCPVQLSSHIVNVTHCPPHTGIHINTLTQHAFMHAEENTVFNVMTPELSFFLCSHIFLVVFFDVRPLMSHLCVTKRKTCSQTTD